MDVQPLPSPRRRAAVTAACVLALFAGSARAQLENTADVLASATRNSSAIAIGDGHLYLPEIRTAQGFPFLHLKRWEGGLWKDTPFAKNVPGQGFGVALFSSDRVPGFYVSTGLWTIRVQDGVETVLLPSRPRIVDAVSAGGMAKLLVIDAAQQARWAGATIDAPVSSEARRVRHAAASDDGRVFAMSDLDGQGPGTDHGVFVTGGGPWQQVPGLTVSAADVEVASIAWDSTASRVVVAGFGLRVDGRPAAAQLAVTAGSGWMAWDGGWSDDRRVLARRLQDGAVYLVDRSPTSLKPQAVLRMDGARLVAAISDPPEFASFGDSSEPPGMAANASGLVLDTARGLMRFPPQGRPELLGLRVRGRSGDAVVAHGPSDRLYVMAEVEDGAFRSDSGAFRQGGRWVGVPPLPSDGVYDIRSVAPSDGALVVASRSGNGRVWRFRDAWEGLPPLADPPATIDQLAAGPGDEVVLVGQGRAVEYATGQWRRIESPEPIHHVAWDFGAEPRLHALRTDPATGLRHIDARDPSGWRRVTAAPAGDLRAFQFDPSGTLIANSSAHADGGGPAVLRWRNGAWEPFRSAVDFASGRPVRTAAGVLLEGGRGPWVVGACSGYATTVYNATGISPPAAPPIAAAFAGRHAYWIDGTGLRRWAIAAVPAGALRLPDRAPSSVDVELGGPPAAVFVGANLCASAVPTELRIKLTGGSSVEGDERLLLPDQPRIEARFDAPTRTLRLSARPGMSPSLSDWDVALAHVQVAARASTYRTLGPWRAVAEVDVPGSAMFGFARALYEKSAPSALRLVAPRELSAIAGAPLRLTGVRVEGGTPSGQRIELSASALLPGLSASESPGVAVERIGTTGLRVTAEREPLQAWLDAGHLQFQGPGALAQDVDVVLSARSGSLGAHARTTLRVGAAAPVIARPDHLLVPRGSTDITLRVLDNDVFAAADLSSAPLSILSGLSGLNTWVETGDTATPADDVIRLRLERGLVATRTFSYQLCSRSACSTATARIVPALSPETTVLIDATADRGERGVELSAFEATPLLRFEATGWSQPTTEVVALEGGRPGDPILAAPGPSRVLRTQIVPASSIDRTLRISIEVAGVDAEVALMAGAGETPGEWGAQCVRSAFGQSQVCELEIRQPSGAPLTWWWSAQNLSGSSVALRAETAVAVSPVDGSAAVAERPAVTGPSILPAPLRPMLRLAWDLPTLVAGERRVAWVRVTGANEEDLGWQRIELRGASGGVAKADRVLAPGRERRLRLDRGATGLYVDVPAGASTLRVDLTASPLPLGALSLRGDGGPSPFPAPDANGATSLTIAAPAAGRYWIDHAPPGSATELRATATITAQAPRLSAGGLFDPSRPGAGLFLHPAGGDWAGLLYTYDHAALPTWYYLQAPAPGPGGQWVSPVYRSEWAQGRNRLVVVGEALVSALAPDRALLSLTIGDRHWRQVLVGFGGGCPTIDGVRRNVSAHWFDPTRSGSGYTVQFFPDYEFYALYLYDALGQPRFAVAELPRAGRLEQAIDVEQLEREDSCSGECPPIAAFRRTRAGTITRVLGPVGLQSLDIDVRFVERAGLSGAWRVSDRPIPLGELQGCGPGAAPARATSPVDISR